MAHRPGELPQYFMTKVQNLETELFVLYSIGNRAVMIPLISGSGIGIAIWTKEPEPIPRWNRLQAWNRIQIRVISHNIYQILGK